MNVLRMSKSQNLIPPRAATMAAAGDSKRGSIDDFFDDDSLMTSFPSSKEITDVIQVVEREIESICSIGDYRVTQRKESLSLVRRVKLLSLFSDEIKELGGPIPETAQPALRDLKKALFAAKRMLKTSAESARFIWHWSSETMVGMFQFVNGKLSEALDKMPYDELGISDETKEQIELMCVLYTRYGASHGHDGCVQRRR